jgi:deoxycytidine triphosphate deaminase
MILSDRTIREELAAGRIVIDPLDDSCIQPSSVDLRLDRLFRVFLNHTMPVIDVKEDLEDLTRLVEIDEGDAFILHPGEFVLGSTFEQVSLPDDLVARIEGKSSLGRLGLLIHSSLPGSEPVVVLDGDTLVSRPIQDVVRKRQPARVVAFNPETFEIGYHEITGWYEGPPDRIYEVALGSGRRVRVTAGHNLFTVDRRGDLEKVRTGELRAGVRIATPRTIPEPTTTRGRRVDEHKLLTPAPPPNEPLVSLRRFDNGLLWDEVVAVRDTGVVEPIFDLEVRPGGRKIENFLAGQGGVFVSNTAGFIDAGFSGHITLELSNVANLPITLYPGMKIGQVSFLRMTTPADVPYGSSKVGSKYQGQRGPTPSRYWENFRDQRR